jgi:hypothetical protein
MPNRLDRLCLFSLLTAICLGQMGYSDQSTFFLVVGMIAFGADALHFLIKGDK